MLTIKNPFHAALLLLILLCTQSLHAGTTPQLGDLAPQFTLRTLDQQAVSLKDAAATSPVLLVVLRGWPGYQCPMCTKQVHDYVEHAGDFKKSGVKVVMVYPGPAEELTKHAEEFLSDKQWPSEFTLVIDPDYAFTNQFGLRWDAPKETAYPSTFLIGSDLKVRFVHVSHSHGDRVNAASALQAISSSKTN